MYSHVIAMYSNVLPCITVLTINFHVLQCTALYCHVLPCTNVFSYGLHLTHCSFHVGSLHLRMCFFGCISLARVFILRVAEFSLSSYISSKYFLAVDFIILREFFFSFAARPSTA